jgi:GntR family transcriptional regulator
MTTPAAGRRWQIIGDLRAQIADGRLQAGGTVPSEAALTVRYQLSRETVRKALRALEHEGLIYSSGPGLPRRVRRRDPLEVHVTPRESQAWQADMAGRETVTEITVEIEGSLLVRDVLRAVDGEAHNWARWEFPLNVASGTALAQREDLPEGAVRELEKLGWKDLQQTVAFESRPPTEAEIAELKLPTGPWVMAEYRTGRKNGKVIFRSVRILRADRTRMIVEF